MLVTFLVIISMAHVIEPALSSPVLLKTSDPRAKRDAMTMPDYLMSFGYIDKDSMSASNLRSREDLKKALTTLQKIGHIPETGKMDAATKDLMTKPRCGMPDMPEGGRERRYVHSGTRWDHKDITWNLGLTPPGLSRESLKRDVTRAFQVWARHSSLTFHERAGDPKADIQITFNSGSHGDQNAFDGRGMVLAHAFGPDMYNAIGGDTHFDADEEWTLEYRTDRQGTHFFMVALHEFGHSLGLKHSEVMASVMYPWYSGTDNNNLEEDDVLAIELLYGKNERGEGGNWGPARSPVPTPSYPPQRPERPPQRPDWPPQRPDWPPQRPERPPQRPERPPQRPDRRRPEIPVYSPSTERAGNPPVWRDPTRIPYVSTSTTSELPSTPNTPSSCDINYDAISILRSELYIFKDDLFWRVRVPDFAKDRNPPTLRSRLWSGMPDGNVDAVYERPNGDIVFFMGRSYYVYAGVALKHGPLPLTRLGLPASLDKVDAATRFKEHTFLFAGKSYWKFDEDTGYVARDYPRRISEGWAGLDGDIDAALQWDDKHMYFFKGKHFARYDDVRMRVEDMDRTSASFWMNCKGSAASVVPTGIGYLMLLLVFHVYWYLEVADRLQ